MSIARQHAAFTAPGRNQNPSRLSTDTPKNGRAIAAQARNETTLAAKTNRHVLENAAGHVCGGGPFSSQRCSLPRGNDQRHQFVVFEGRGIRAVMIGPGETATGGASTLSW
jgi:hypothetical protein